MRYISPLEQFEVYIVKILNLFGVSIYITNMTLSLFVVVFVIYIIFINYGSEGKLVPNNGQRLSELLYIFINNLVKQQAGIKGLKYFPMLLLLFYFIFFLNLIGLLPFGFTNTSQIVYTFTLGFLCL
jgi:F-type H+-transporting ATPase subunit a